VQPFELGGHAKH